MLNGIKQDNDCDNGFAYRNNYLPQDTEIPRSVDFGRVVELLRNGGKRSPHYDNVVGGQRGGQNNGPTGVQKS